MRYLMATMLAGSMAMFARHAQAAEDDHRGLHQELDQPGL